MSPLYPISKFSERQFLRLKQCWVTNESTDHELFVIHEFDNEDVCFDSTRLNVVQTGFAPTASFTMKTFRFVTSESATNAQQQTISCTLHLDSIDDLVEEQAQPCTCFTESECEAANTTAGLSNQEPFNGRIFVMQPGENRRLMLDAEGLSFFSKFIFYFK